MSRRKVAALAVGVLLAIGIGIAAILVANSRFLIAGAGSVLIIIGLVGLMPLFEAALGD